MCVECRVYVPLSEGWGNRKRSFSLEVQSETHKAPRIERANCSC